MFFTLLMILGGTCLIGGVFLCLWIMNEPPAAVCSNTRKNVYTIGVIAIISGIVVFMVGYRPLFNAIIEQQPANWLVIDNSGGETLRHWVLEGGYVKSSDQSDGWQFYDNGRNLCYVSDDCFVMKINQPLAQFLQSYKTEYNIPEEQKALK